MTAHQGLPQQPDRGGEPSSIGDAGRLRRGPRLSYWMARDLFVLAELGLIVLTSVIAEYIYIGAVLASPQANARYFTAGIICALITFVVFKSYGLYSRGDLLEGKSESSRVVLAISFSFMLLVTLAYVTKSSGDFSRGWLLLWYSLSAIIVPASRRLFKPAHQWLVGRRVITQRLAIVGDAAAAQRLFAEFKAFPHIEVAGIYAGEGAPSQESIDELIRVGQRGLIDEIVVVLTGSAAATRTQLELIEPLRVLPIDIRLYSEQVPDGVEIREVRRIGRLNLLGITTKPVRDWGYLIKLAEDYVIAGLALVLLSPVLAVIALLVKLDSPGPVFFRQQRHGYNHRVIRVFKFRTMTVMQDGAEVPQAEADDKRVTRIGRVLRRTSLDELPQLINVITGEMSLVGPRPHAVAHNEHYAPLLEGYARRHRMKPGITGWAQINGLRGPTKDPELMRQRMQYDLHYIENWSFWLDMEILMRTLFEVIRQRNAH